jgi:hypothetical protein
VHAEVVCDFLHGVNAGEEGTSHRFAVEEDRCVPSTDLQSRLGLALPEEAISGIETVRDLLRDSTDAGDAGLEGPDLEERLRDPEALLDADQFA